MTERMRATAKHEYTWYLEPPARFTWTKSGAHGGHEFTVELVALELFEGMPDRAPCIRLMGPWLNGFRPPERLGDTVNGWQFLYADALSDADRIRELPLEIREALAERGLTIPL